MTLHPDYPITQTGVLREFRHKPVGSRFGQRTDLHHMWMDPIIVGAPWAVAVGASWIAIRKVGGGRPQG